MDADRIKRLRELLDKATPGPWYTGHLCRDDHTCTCPFVYAEGQAGMGAIATVGTTDEDVSSIDEAKANQALIAAMHEALPDLLALAEAVRDAPEGSVFALRHASGGKSVYLSGFNPDELAPMEGQRVKLIRADAAMGLPVEGGDG